MLTVLLHCLWEGITQTRSIQSSKGMSLRSFSVRYTTIYTKCCEINSITLYKRNQSQMTTPPSRWVHQTSPGACFLHGSPWGVVLLHMQRLQAAWSLLSTLARHSAWRTGSTLWRHGKWRCNEHAGQLWISAGPENRYSQRHTHELTPCT